MIGIDSRAAALIGAGLIAAAALAFVAERNVAAPPEVTELIRPASS